MSTPTKPQLQATARELGVSDEGNTRELIARIREAREAPAPAGDAELDLVLPTGDDPDLAEGLEPPAPPAPPTQDDPPPLELADELELVDRLADTARRRSAGAAAVFAMAYAPSGEVMRLEVTRRGPAAWHRAEELVAIAGGGDLAPAVVTVEPNAGRVQLSDRTVDVTIGATI